MAYTRVGDLLLGMLGLSLLRSRVQDLGGQAFCDERIAEMRHILAYWDAPALRADASWEEATANEGYAAWASSYDSGGNPLIDLDAATLAPILSRYPAGTALDVACGTGRWAAYLAQRGHVVHGIDTSPDMLEIARAKVPVAQFSLADMRDLPVPSDSVDLVVCSLALTHLPDLRTPLAEFARVLRRGGYAIVSNIHHQSLPLGGTPEILTSAGRRIRLPSSQFLPTDYINAGLHLGLSIVSCAEIKWPDLGEGLGGSTAQAWCPEAARVAYTSTPALMVVEFEKAPSR